MDDVGGWLQLLFQQRFFVIFSLLFGISFSLMLESAVRRGCPNPRTILARRLVAILPLGVLHQILHPGEALLPYALAGLLVLLPSTWLSRNWLALLTVAAVPAALALGGGLLLIPALFLLGSTLVRCQLISYAVSSSRAATALLLISSAAALPAMVAQAADIGNSGSSVVSAIAGLAMAGFYVAILLLALQTSARRILTGIFAPLGRMALTNYIAATLLMHASNAILDFPSTGSWSLLLGTAFMILSIQVFWSIVWLRRFDQGPLEYLWRWLTWGSRHHLVLHRLHPGNE